MNHTKDKKLAVHLINSNSDQNTKQEGSIGVKLNMQTSLHTITILLESLPSITNALQANED